MRSYLIVIETEEVQVKLVVRVEDEDNEIRVQFQYPEVYLNQERYLRVEEIEDATSKSS